MSKKKYNNRFAVINKRIYFDIEDLIVIAGVIEDLNFVKRLTTSRKMIEDYLKKQKDFDFKNMERKINFEILDRVLSEKEIKDYCHKHGVVVEESQEGRLKKLIKLVKKLKPKPIKRSRPEE